MKASLILGAIFAVAALTACEKKEDTAPVVVVEPSQPAPTSVVLEPATVAAPDASTEPAQK